MSLLSVMNQWTLLTLSTEAKTILGMKMAEKMILRDVIKQTTSYVLCAKFELTQYYSEKDRGS